MTITDVYTTPTDSGTRVVTRVTLEGERAGDTIDYDGAPPRLGRTLEVITGEYEVEGQLRALGRGDELTTGTTTVLVRDVFSESDVEALNPGDSVTVAGRRVAIVENVTVQPTDDPARRRVYTTLNLSTLTRDGVVRFGGQRLRSGQSFRMVAPEFTLDGRIDAIGEGPRVETESIVLRSRVPAERARRIAPGDTVNLAGQTVATVDARRIYSTEDPDERVVFLTVDLTAVRQAGVLRFGETAVRRGQQLTLDTGGYAVTGVVDHVGGGLATSRTNVLVRDTVDSETVDRLSVGDRFRVAGDTTATVTNVSAYGTSNSDRKRVLVGLTLRTVSYGEVPQFGGAFVQDGNNLTVTTDAYELAGEVERVGTTSQRGTPSTRTVTLRLDDVREDLAQSLRAGMVERTGGETLARLTRVRRTPSTILVRSDDGTLGVYDHPTLRDVTIVAELDVRETGDGVRFKDETIQLGGTVTLDLGTITVEMTVVDIGG